MARRSRIADIEAREGLSISEVLSNLYNKHDSQKEIARELGISQPSLSLWLVRIGLKEKTILVPRDEGRQDVSA